VTESGVVWVHPSFMYWRCGPQYGNVRGGGNFERWNLVGGKYIMGTLASEGISIVLLGPQLVSSRMNYYQRGSLALLVLGQPVLLCDPAQFTLAIMPSAVL
jgi:hypothetical protein